MSKKLENAKIAILATDGFEQVELTEPLASLHAAGAKTELVSPAPHIIKGWKKNEWGDEFKVEKKLDEANPEDYDALLLPGGVMNPDQLRKNEKAVKFVDHFFTAGKAIAAICHGPWTLIETGKVQGRKLTSYDSIKTDLKNAGAEWVDEAAVVDNGLVTSRNPNDLPEFNEKMIEEFARVIMLNEDVLSIHQ